MKCTFCKVINYEYWHPFVWHVLGLPVHIYNSLKCRSFFYFTALNPNFGKTGGFIGDSKKEIQDFLPETYSLKDSVLENFADFEKEINCLELNYPVVLKPISGERGEGVKVIHSLKEAETYFKEQPKKYKKLLQEFSTYKEEFGIFVYNHPHRGWQISGVNIKKPFVVKGDGESTVLSLINQKCRYRQQLDRIISEGVIDLQRVPKVGEIVLLEKVLNHRFGTEFINCTNLINDKFRSVIIGICSQVPGFDYGRFDIKANSFEDIQQHNFKVIELNGAAAEPTIIYDQQNTGFFKSWSIIIRHLYIQGQIAKRNIGLGHKPASYKVIRQAFKSHFS